MNQDLDPLLAALHGHRTKLHGMDEAAAKQAATEGKRLLILTTNPRTFTGDGDELLLASEGQSTWGCGATEQRLLEWLHDDEVIAICNDELPDVRPCGLHAPDVE